MRHLKLFEKFQNLYNHITEDDFMDNETRTNLNFDETLINQIEERLNPHFRLKVQNLNNSGAVHLDITHYGMDSTWEVWQTSDDWFMVHALYNLDRDDEVGPGEDYFECDTFEGLLQLLEDHEVIL